MPLPVGHSLAGGALWAAGDSRPGVWAGWKRLALAVFIANAPDLDMIPGILMGDPDRFHHGPSHSLGFALLAAVIATLVARAWRPWPLGTGASAGSGEPARSGESAGSSEFAGGWWPALQTGALVGAIWLSHVVLDAFAQDYSEPRGVPALWPLTDRYFNPYGWFPWVDKLGGQGTPVEFFTSLLSPQNVWAMSVEVLTLLPVVIVIVLWRRSRTGPTPGDAGASGSPRGRERG